MQGGAESSRTDETGYLPVYSAAVSHRCKNALVWQLSGRRKGGAVKGNEAGVYSGCGLEIEVHDRVASGAVGAGYFRRD